MSRPGTRSVEPTAGKWLWVPTTQTMHDGSLLRMQGVRLTETGQWIGKVHALGTSREHQAEAYANGGLLAASKEMAALLQEATKVWPRQFDGGSRQDCAVPGADLTQWFAQWRLRVRATLDKAGVP